MKRTMPTPVPVGSRRRRTLAAPPSLPAMAMLTVAAALLVATSLPGGAAFAPSSLQSRTLRNGCDPRSRFQPRNPSLSPPPSRSGSGTALSVLGQEGIFGVGAPEIAVTLIVGYFVLGPSDLYKLVKEVGKFVQNFRTLGTEAAKSFEGTMENQLELTELRKAQAELNDAFGFRRSINTDASSAFENNNWAENIAANEAAGMGAAGVGAAAAVAEGAEGGGAKKKKRRLVRRKKKKAAEEIDVPPEESVLGPEKGAAEEYPDLDMLDVPDSSKGEEPTEEEKLRAERAARLTGGGSSDGTPDEPEWFTPPKEESKEPDWFTASEEQVANEVLSQKDPALEAFEKQRFQSQLSADEWNKQIMANEDELAPLSMVMKRLAILEEEKNAADKRLEEEYQRRMDNEDKYYLEKRQVLMEAIEDIQGDVYGGKGAKGEGTEIGANATKIA